MIPEYDLKLFYEISIHSYMTPEYDLKHFYETPIHSYMIPEHFHAILS